MRCTMHVQFTGEKNEKGLAKHMTGKGLCPPNKPTTPTYFLQFPASWPESRNVSFNVLNPLPKISSLCSASFMTPFLLFFLVFVVSGGRGGQAKPLYC